MFVSLCVACINMVCVRKHEICFKPVITPKGRVTASAVVCGEGKKTALRSAITIYFRVRKIHNGTELWFRPEAQSAVFSTSDSLSVIGTGFCLPNNGSLEVGPWRPRGPALPLFPSSLGRSPRHHRFSVGVDVL